MRVVVWARPSPLGVLGGLLYVARGPWGEESGDIIDRLIPRDQVRLRDDLAAGEAAKLEVHTVKTRKATYEDIQRNPSLCNESYE